MKEKNRYDFHQNMLLLTVVLLGGLSLTIFAIDQGFSVTGMVTGVSEQSQEPIDLQGVSLEVGDTVTFDLDRYFNEEGTYYDFRTSDGYTTSIEDSLVTVEALQSGTWTMRGFVMINGTLEETGEYILEVENNEESQQPNNANNQNAQTPSENNSEENNNESQPEDFEVLPPGQVDNINETPQNNSEENINQSQPEDFEVLPPGEVDDINETPQNNCQPNQCNLNGQCINENETRNNMLCKSSTLYSEERFNVENQNEELFLVDNQGNAWLQGSLIENCNDQPQGRYYQVVDEQRLFFINSTGHMCLTGQLFENSNVQQVCENANCFTVGQEENVLGITSNGNMHITGTLTTQ